MAEPEILPASAEQPQETVAQSAAPVEVPVAVVEAPAVVEAVADAPQLATDVPSLLETIKTPGAEEPKADEPKVEAKPADKPEAAKADAPKPDDVKLDAEPVKPAPLDYKYELPETIKMDDATKGELHSALDTYRADPTNAQPLIDLHNKAMTAFAEQTLANQHKAFLDTRKGWVKEIMADPELGGAGFQTTAQTVARMRDQFVSQHPVGTPDYQADFNAFDGMIRATGVGDHPVFWRFLHNMARFFDEPSMPPPDAKPAPNNGRPGKASDVLYDNPRSTSNGRQ